MTKMKALMFGLMASTMAISTSPTKAYADSCWNHNGSIMRLEANGNQRWFRYEQPREVLQRAGVMPGTLLFDGENRNGHYTGYSRVFSKYCIGNPAEYAVEGWVEHNPLRVVIQGPREVYNRCDPTGRKPTDRLVFTYAYQC